MTRAQEEREVSLVKRLGFTVAVAVSALLLTASAASAQEQPPPIPTPAGPQNPWPAGKKVDVAFHVETLTASPRESIYGRWAPTSCTQTNFFARGERVVWHIGAVNARTGEVLTNNQVQYAYLVIPGMKNVGVTWVPHGRDPVTAAWTWTARWDIPLDYPLGVVPFKLVMKLKGWPKNKVQSWTQIPMPITQLTVIDKR